MPPATPRTLLVGACMVLRKRGVCMTETIAATKQAGCFLTFHTGKKHASEDTSRRSHMYCTSLCGVCMTEAIAATKQVGCLLTVHTETKNMQVRTHRGAHILYEPLRHVYDGSHCGNKASGMPSHGPYRKKACKSSLCGVCMTQAIAATNQVGCLLTFHTEEKQTMQVRTHRGAHVSSPPPPELLSPIGRSYRYIFMFLIILVIPGMGGGPGFSFSWRAFRPLGP